MSEKYVPKKGDRVRVVLEGEVTGIYSSRRDMFDIGLSDGNTVFSDAPHVVSVERLPDPLPTTPGSVVRCRNTWVLGKKGLWRSPTVSKHDGLPRRTAEQMVLYARGVPIVVLFDAGKSA